MAIKYLDDLNPDGTVLGQTSAALVAFYGNTPVARRTVVTNTTGTLGNTNTAVNAIITVLTSLGLMG